MATFLLKLALALLIAAQGPNVPQELRIQAISVANSAIQYAETHQATSSEAAPQFGSIDYPLQTTITQPVASSSVPMCILTVSSTTSPSQQKVYAFDWTTENATSGKITQIDSDGRFVNISDSISSGHWGNLDSYVGWTAGKSANFQLKVLGNGGEATCRGNS